MEGKGSLYRITEYGRRPNGVAARPAAHTEHTAAFHGSGCSGGSEEQHPHCNNRDRRKTAKLEHTILSNGEADRPVVLVGFIRSARNIAGFLTHSERR